VIMEAVAGKARLAKAADVRKNPTFLTLDPPCGTRAKPRFTIS